MKIERWELDSDRDGAAMKRDDYGDWVCYDDIKPLIALKNYILDEFAECFEAGVNDISAEDLADEMVKLGFIKKVPYDPEKHGELEEDVPHGEEIFWWGDDE